MGSVKGRRQGRQMKRRLRTQMNAWSSRIGSSRSLTHRWSYTLRDSVAQRGQTSNSDVFSANNMTPPSSADRKSTRLNSSHVRISYAVFCLKKKKNKYLNDLKA